MYYYILRFQEEFLPQFIIKLRDSTGTADGHPAVTTDNERRDTRHEVEQIQKDAGRVGRVLD